MPPKRGASSSGVIKSKSKSKRSNMKRSSFSTLSKAATSKSSPAASTIVGTKMAAVAATAASASPEDRGSKPVYFWKPSQGHGYLGQWYPSEFTHEGDTYATAEMWMMVQKAKLFGDENVARSMLETRDPKTHKSLGRKVKNFDEKVWDDNKRRIVEEGSYHKFTISEDAENLRKMLLETGERELVEASPLDRIWGVGFGEKNAGPNRHRWGQNLLGKALMDVRKRLREEEEEEEEEEASKKGE